jgi:GT2 family glycosyltransferase
MVLNGNTHNMSSRIIMTVYALEGSKRIEYAKKSLNSLIAVTNFSTHELFISDNGSCDEMLEFYKEFSIVFGCIFPDENLIISLNGKNLGTSGGLNEGLKERKPNQYCIKIDDDVVVNTKDWVDKMEECFERFDNLGILGAKRRELVQHPDHENLAYRTVIKYLKHERGQTWIPIELCDDIIGTLTMFSPSLLDKVGFGFQPSLYGFDDCLWSLRSKLAGFTNAFLPTIQIDHIDTGEGEFVMWKQKHAGEIIAEFSEIAEDYKKGVRDIYYNPFEI